MGYHTEFQGRVATVPPLNTADASYLKKFNESRRMQRSSGPYFVEGTGFMGQGKDSDVLDYNRPPAGQPSLWCGWVPTDDGTAIEWDGAEKFYDSAEWMQYLIDHFLAPGAKAKGALPFLQANHTVNGVILAQGEELADSWKLVVTDNRVSTEGR